MEKNYVSTGAILCTLFRHIYISSPPSVKLVNSMLLIPIHIREKLTCVGEVKGEYYISIAYSKIGVDCVCVCVWGGGG